MKKSFLLLLLVVVLLGCKEEKKSSKKDKIESKYDVYLEQKLAINTSFPIGNVRRYGIEPDQGIGVHPITKNKKVDEIIRLASSGLEIVFPKGYYKTSLILSKKEKISLKFEEAEFSGSIQLKDSCNNMLLKGNVKTYSSFVFNNVHNITLGELTVLDNKEKNISKLRPSGVHILNDSRDIMIDKVLIEGIGENKYSHAALKIYGYPKLPKYIKINELSILSSDVNGVLIMGEEIHINNTYIKSFGSSNENNLAKLSNLPKDFDKKNYVGFWLNKNISSVYEYVEVNTVEKQIALRLGGGSPEDPTVISSLKLQDKKKSEYLVDDAETTNVVVEKLL